jgi:beta-xylosidase
MDVSSMNDGDFAGLALLQKQYGLVGVKCENGQKRVVMVNAGSSPLYESEGVPLKQQVIYLKASCDFSSKTDTAHFYYSLDGKTWNPIGNTLKMKYDLAHFMGYRFALFNYPTKKTGGYVDFDWFRVAIE